MQDLERRQNFKGGLSERMAVPNFSTDKTGDELGRRGSRRTLAGREAGLKMQFIDTQDNFRFGASKLFRTFFTATILRSSLVDAASWSGLPSSRKRFPFFCQETRTQRLGHLGAEDLKLTTENGHPAISVQVKGLPTFTLPTPQKWAGDEVRLLPSSESHAAYMTTTCESSERASASTFATSRSCESACVTDGGADRNLSQPFETIFHPKKLSPFVFNFLSAEALNTDVFMRWWSETKLAKLLDRNGFFFHTNTRHSPESIVLPRCTQVRATFEINSSTTLGRSEAPLL